MIASKDPLSRNSTQEPLVAGGIESEEQLTHVTLPNTQIETTIPVMTRGERRTYRMLVIFWMLPMLLFWSWWFRPTHITTIPRLLLPSFVLLYTFAMPAYFFVFLGRMRRPNPALSLPQGLRVTFATTFVPGAEGLDVLERTIIAMRDQEGYPHDVWVLDEGNTPAAKALCARVGVHHFSRKGIERYQAAVWPFRARTKAGNYNAWLDWLESSDISYDIVLQMDTDHVPQPGYMMEMLRPFADPQVAYVAAPSIISGNKDDSWVVRGRYEVEATLHGALQMGYNSGFAPLIIGSHAAFRVPALRAIGGFQHTLAEDHHNTLRFNARGMRGVFSPNAIAIGDGAASFADAMVQEYQWARALTQILLNFFPEERHTLPPRLQMEFVFAETWYPLFGLTLLYGWLMPIIALLTNRPWIRVSYPLFLLIDGLVTFSSLGLVFWVRRRGWLRPRDAAVISWRSVMLMLARWPFVLMAVIEAVLGRFMRRDFPFKVTPKGVPGHKALPLRTIFPYLVIAGGSLLAIVYHVIRAGLTDVDGYVYLALMNAGMYLGLLAAIVILNMRENARVHGVPGITNLRIHAPSLALVAALGVIFAVLTPLVADHIVSTITTFSPSAPPAGGNVAYLATAQAWTPPPPPGRISPTNTPSPLRTAVPSTFAPSQSPATPVVAEVQSPNSWRNLLVLPVTRPFFGIYDPAKEPGSGKVDTEIIFVQWKPGVGKEVYAEIERILRAGRVPIITVEPFPWNIDGLSDKTLLADIAAGRYDAPITEIGKAVAVFAPQPVYLRFGQEMDLTGIYPWAKGDPHRYAAAFRHFVDAIRGLPATNAYFIWSPSGNDGSADFYPGDDIVDMIGVTLLVAQEWEEAAALTVPRTFAQVLRERYGLGAQFDKPLAVIEMGVDLRDPAAKTAWLADARRSLNEFPTLAGIVYFDDRNPPMTGVASRPDWHLTDAQRAIVFAPYTPTAGIGERPALTTPAIYASQSVQRSAK